MLKWVYILMVLWVLFLFSDQGKQRRLSLYKPHCTENIWKQSGSPQSYIFVTLEKSTVYFKQIPHLLFSSLLNFYEICVIPLTLTVPVTTIDALRHFETA